MAALRLFRLSAPTLFRLRKLFFLLGAHIAFVLAQSLRIEPFGVFRRAFVRPCMLLRRLFLLHVRGTLLFECLLTFCSCKPLLLPCALVFCAPRALIRGLGLLVIRQRSRRLLLFLRAVEFAVVDVNVLRMQRLAAGILRRVLIFGGKMLRNLAVRFAEQAFYILQKRIDVLQGCLFGLIFLPGLHWIFVFHTMFSFHFPRSRSGWWKESPINIASL